MKVFFVAAAMVCLGVALLAQSELRRCMLQVEYAQLADTAGWIDRGLRLVKSLSPWLLLAAPLAGYFLIRKRSHPLGLWMKCWSAWRWLRRFWPFARAIFDAEQ